MKYLYTAFLSILVSAGAFATNWDIAVANFSFSPSTINAVVGDVIIFHWASGFHTTTCGSDLPGTSRPAGAADWNNDMDPSSTTFSYTVTVQGNYVYGCIPHWGGGNGMRGNLVVSGAVPVKLGMFTVENERNTAKIGWKTFAEINTSYFSIRRSIDGNHFTEVGRVPAAGNSSVEKAYHFSDNNLGKSRYVYYELVTVDLDRTESFSDIKVIKNDAGTDDLIVSLGPNPIVRPNQMQVQFNAESQGQMSVKIFSMSGKLLMTTSMAAFYGLNNAHLHICELGKGTYSILFELEKRKVTRKIVVQ